MKKLSLTSLGILSFSTIILGATPVLATPEEPEAKTNATVLFEPDDETPTTEVEGGGEGEVDPGGSEGSIGDGNPAFNITFVSHFRFNKTNEDGTTYAPIAWSGNGVNLWAYGTKLTLNRKVTDKLLVDPEATLPELAEGQSINQKLEYKNLRNFIQITDNRGAKDGEGGWNLQVKGTDFTAVDGETTYTLTGAELSLNQAEIVSPVGITKPTGFEGKLVISKENGTVMNAADQTATGSTYMYFGDTASKDTPVISTVTGPEGMTIPEVQVPTYKELKLVDGKPTSGVNLNVPAEAQAKTGLTYQAELTWTLISGPAPEEA